MVSRSKAAARGTGLRRSAGELAPLLAGPAAWLGLDALVVLEQARPGAAGAYRVAASAGAMRWRPGAEYPLESSACAAVLAHGALAVPRGAAARFPSDPLFARRRIEAVVGVRLGEAGGPLGALVALLHRRPDPGGLRRVRAALRQLAPVIGAGLEARRPGAGLPREFVHALNNFLGIVAGNAELIAGEVDEGSLAADCVAEIRAAAGRIEALLGRPRAVPSKAAPVERPARPQGVLLVDDEPGVRRMAAAILEQAGLRSFPAASAEEAIEALSARAGEIGLVLLDLDLPDSTGAQLLGRLRAIRPGLPALVMTGSTEDEARRAIGAAAVCGVVEKPFSIETLVPAVKAGLSGAGG
jgi:CheY-like chemotaxis protein